MEKRKTPDLAFLDKSRISLDQVGNGTISKAILNELIRELKSSYLHFLVFKLALLTGMKPQEMVDLKKKHLDAKTKSIYVPHNYRNIHGKGRWIGLDPYFFLELQRFSQNLGEDAYLFSGRDGSMSWRSLSYTFAKIQKATHYRIGFRDLQKSFCLELMKRGASLEEIAYFLGYKSLASVRRKFRRMEWVDQDKYDILNTLFLKSA